MKLIGYVFFAILFIILNILPVFCAVTVPNSPCPSIFQYKFENGIWYGYIQLLFQETSVYLGLTYYLKVDVADNNKGVVTMIGDDEENELKIKRGELVSFKFDFPLQNSLPHIRYIKVNNQIKCEGEDSPDKRVLITLNNSFVWNVISVPVKETVPVVIHRPPDKINFQNKQPSHSANNLFEKAQQICGTIGKRLKPVHLIYEGTKIGFHDEPWLVAMFEIEKGAPSFYCGASLITNYHILTAAHCVMKNKEIYVKLGAKNINNINEDETVFRLVKNKYIHPEYNKEKHYSHADIAIITVSEPIEFTETIRPVCIWQFSPDVKLIQNKVGTVTGWGLTEQGVPTADPKTTKIRIIPPEECKKTTKLLPIISDKTLCGTGLVPGSGPCKGDSGGPLTFFNRNRHYIRGIVSASIGDEQKNVCDLKNYATVYSDVAKFVDWIYDTVINKL